MNYNRLGTSDLYISEIGFGCMSLGDREDDTSELIQYALDRGINFFDTADLYNKGMNEISVGKALKGIRNEVVLATKVGNQWKPDGSGWDWNPGKNYILAAVEKSLARLGTDHIDLYQLHGGTINDPIDDIIEAFGILQHQGKIRHYGISSIRPNVIREYVRRSSIVSVMMQYSLIDRRPEETCMKLLEENNTGILARGVLAQGLLAGKPAKEFLNYSIEQVRNASAAINSVSGQHRTAVQTAIRFVLSNPGVSSAVLGIRTKKQLEEIVNAADVPRLNDEEMKFLTDSLTANVYEEHR